MFRSLVIWAGGEAGGAPARWHRPTTRLHLTRVGQWQGRFTFPFADRHPALSPPVPREWHSLINSIIGMRILLRSALVHFLRKRQFPA